MTRRKKPGQAGTEKTPAKAASNPAARPKSASKAISAAKKPDEIKSKPAAKKTGHEAEIAKTGIDTDGEVALKDAAKTDTRIQAEKASDAPAMAQRIVKAVVADEPTAFDEAPAPAREAIGSAVHGMIREDAPREDAVHEDMAHEGADHDAPHPTTAAAADADASRRPAADTEAPADPVAAPWSAIAAPYDRVQACGRLMMDAASAERDFNLELGSRLASARSPVDLFAIATEFSNRRLGMLTDFSRGLAEIATGRRSGRTRP